MISSCLKLATEHQNEERWQVAWGEGQCLGPPSQTAIAQGREPAGCAHESQSRRSSRRKWGWSSGHARCVEMDGPVAYHGRHGLPSRHLVDPCLDGTMALRASCMHVIGCSQCPGMLQQSQTMRGLLFGTGRGCFYQGHNVPNL